MLNIGRLAPGAADYYVGEIATSAEDYYTGHGEAPGRWVGSLAAGLGLAGKVDPEQFRAVLDGRHPFTNEQLAAPRNHRSASTSGPDQAGLFDGDTLDVARTAARLHLTVQHVRRLLFAGTKNPADRPDSFLRGTREGPRGNWVVERSEVERFEAMHVGGKARPGYDLTLRPPKSVSVLWALADEPTRRIIRQAHADAVDRVVDYVESHALYARKRTSDGRRDRVMTDGVIAAAFDHRTSRAGDPLLHTHVVTANLTKTVEGRWQAIDGRPLYDHARPGGMLYQVELRHLLTERLGVAWGAVRNGWAEIEGVPKAVVRAFSKRRDEIEAMVAESGYTSARAHQSATLATRKAKEYGVDPDHLVARWREEAAVLGFGPDDVAACFHRAPGADHASLTMPAEALRRVLAGPEGLTKHASTFTRKEVVEAVCDMVSADVAAADVERIVDGFLNADHAVPLHPDLTNGTEWVWRRAGTKERDVDLARWTTPELVRLEGELRRWSEVGFGTALHSPPAPLVDAVIAGRPSLNDEQAAMVRGLASPDAGSVQPVSGRPGSGKTYATATYVRALVGSGVPTVGCALAATAAAELEASCRFGPLTGTEATTIARLLRRLQRTPLAQGSVVIVDEASMVGTRDLHRLASHVAAAGGSLKLIGDEKQHGAVETGGFFKQLVQRTREVGNLVELRGNNRQRDDTDRAAIAEFRDGLVEAALARYDTNGHVYRSGTAAAAYQRMVDDWSAAVGDGGHDPMIAGPNRVRRELNHRARAAMAAAGRLDGPMVTTGDGVELQAGDWVVARRNEPRLRSSIGWVKNGSAGTVAAVDPAQRTITVDFGRDGRITLPAAYLDAHGQVEHGYCRTTYGVQGATLDRALYFAGDEASFEEGYVAFTRGRVETRLYLVDGTLLAEDDTTSRAHATRPTGLDTVAVALGRERANALVHDTDPTIGQVRAGYAGWTLNPLRAERLRIETVLRAGPPDVTEEHDETLAARDALLARQRSLALADPRDLRRANDIARSLERIDKRLAAIEPGLEARTRYLDDHPDEVAAYPLIRRAELARELEVRAAAAVVPPHGVVEGLGAAPINPVARRAWTDAAEAVAVHHERYGTSPLPHVPDLGSRILGERPAELFASASWDRAAAAAAAAQDAAAAAERDQTADVEVDLPARVQPELSLLD